MNIFNIFLAVMAFIIDVTLVAVFNAPVTTVIGLLSGNSATMAWIGWFIFIIVLVFVIPLYFAISEDATSKIAAAFGR